MLNFESANVGTPRAWNINAGLSIMGGWSRYNDKKSVSISMREQYQDGRLEYPLLKLVRCKKFKAFNLGIMVIASIGILWKMQWVLYLKALVLIIKDLVK